MNIDEPTPEVKEFFQFIKDHFKPGTRFSFIAMHPEKNKVLLCYAPEVEEISDLADALKIYAQSHQTSPKQDKIRRRVI